MHWGRNTYRCRFNCGGAPEYSGPIRVDAAAWVEEDEVLRSGAGARATEGRERRKTMEKGENEKKTGRGYL